MLIENQRELIGSLRSLSKQVLLPAKVAVFLISDERIRNLLKRILNGLLIGEYRFLILCTGQSEPRAERSARPLGVNAAKF